MKLYQIIDCLGFGALVSAGVLEVYAVSVHIWMQECALVCVCVACALFVLGIVVRLITKKIDKDKK